MTAAANAGTTSAHRTFAVAAAAFVALLVFVPAVHGGFVYDDHRFYEENEALSAPSILWRAFADPSCQTSDGTHPGLWRPLRTLSFALDRAVFGDSPAGPHAVNVLLHAAGTGVLAALLLAWRLPPVAAALGSAAYAVHPAQAEVVAWISSRGDLLAAGLVLGALLADLRGRATAAAVLGTAALLSKEQAVVWPALAFLSRLAAGRGTADAVRGVRVPFAATAAFLVLRQFLLLEPFQEGGLGQGPAGPRTIAAMLGHQAWFAALPVGSIFDWQLPGGVTAGGVPPLPVTLVALAVPAAVFVPGLRIPAAWFLAALVPTLFVQMFVPLNILVADRFLLFALPALALVVARAAATGRAATAAAVVLAASLATLTCGLVPEWRSDASLWLRTAQRVPGHPRANQWLAVVALRAEGVDEAMLYLVPALQANPHDAKALYHFAVAQERAGIRDRSEGMVEAARECYGRAIAAFGRERAEGAGDLLSLARLAEADVVLLLGRRDEARTLLETLLGSDVRPPGGAFRKAWDDRMTRLTTRVAANLGEDLAARLRAWGGRT